MGKAKEILLKFDAIPISFVGFAGGTEDKESACNSETQVLSLGQGDPPGEGNGNPLQYSCLGNPMDRRAWWATVHRVTKESDMT